MTQRLTKAIKRFVDLALIASLAVSASASELRNKIPLDRLDSEPNEQLAKIMILAEASICWEIFMVLASATDGSRQDQIHLLRENHWFDSNAATGDGRLDQVSLMNRVRQLSVLFAGDGVNALSRPRAEILLAAQQEMSRLLISDGSARFCIESVSGDQRKRQRRAERRAKAERLHEWEEAIEEGVVLDTILVPFFELEPSVLSRYPQLQGN